jgi:hypothetical protein
MTYIPEVLALDYETCLLSGEPSVEAYRDDFRVKSCAFAWRQESGEIKTKVTWGESETLKMLERIQSQGIQVVVHNLSFEMAVTKCRFPGIDPMKWTCTMRLTQMADNGGGEKWQQKQDVGYLASVIEGFAPQNGFSLEAAASRFLGRQYYKHKQPYHDKIVGRGGKKKDLHLLTMEELTEYNALDAIVTLELYAKLSEHLVSLKVNPERDHILYRYRCHLTTDARIQGVKVNMAKVDECISVKKQELENIEKNFRIAFKAQIEELEAEMSEEYINKCRTEKGRQNRRNELLEAPIQFNLNSTKQKRRLFVDKLGLDPKFFTDKGEVTMGAKLLWQFGEAGSYLEKLGSTRISLQQTESLKELAERDGRYHIDIKVVGARSGRLSGGQQE